MFLKTFGGMFYCFVFKTLRQLRDWIYVRCENYNKGIDCEGHPARKDHFVA